MKKGDMSNAEREGSQTEPHERPALASVACNACSWVGPVSETCMLGSVGPLCPECRETTEPLVSLVAIHDCDCNTLPHRRGCAIFA